MVPFLRIRGGNPHASIGVERLVVSIGILREVHGQGVSEMRENLDWNRNCTVGLVIKFCIEGFNQTRLSLHGTAYFFFFFVSQLPPTEILMSMFTFYVSSAVPDQCLISV